MSSSVHPSDMDEVGVSGAAGASPQRAPRRVLLVVSGLSGVSSLKHMIRHLERWCTVNIEVMRGYSPVGATNAAQRAIDKAQPDIMVLSGNHYSIFGAAYSAVYNSIPIAHIAGGLEMTIFGHAISKLSHYHFVTSPHAAGILRMIGETAIWVVAEGEAGAEHIAEIISSHDLQDIGPPEPVDLSGLSCED